MTIDLYDGVSLTVEAALDASIGDYGAWDLSLWGTATWGPDELWVDISQWVRSVKVDRSFSRGLQAWQAGTATLVLDNRDARFSPTNLAGPYVTAGVTGIRPLRPVRIRATYAGLTYHLFRGFASDWLESWPDGVDSKVTVPCVDQWALLAGDPALAVAPVGAGETFGARVHRVLDAVGHTGARAVDTGQVTMAATDLSSVPSDELTKVGESEGGAVYVEADGTVTAERQYALLENARSVTVQATFGDGGGPELPCADITWSTSADLLRNEVQYARSGGTTQIAVDTASVALYGGVKRRESRSDLVCETDAQALQLAQWFLARYKDPEQRFTGVEIRPRNLAYVSRLFPQVLGRRVRDLIRVVRYPPAGSTITRDCHIAGIHHDIDTEDQWITRWDLWSATAYQAFATSRWDVGLWGSGTGDTAAAKWFF